MSITPQDQAVRQRVYQLLLATGQMPKIDQLAGELNQSQSEVAAALKRLYAAKALALMPESGEILMASPWSAVPTSYLVEAGGKSWYANCAWDALAISAAMGVPGKVITSCSCCGEAMGAEVDGRRLLSGSGVVHIALPAKTWWDNIFYT